MRRFLIGLCLALCCGGLARAGAAEEEWQSAAEFTKRYGSAKDGISAERASELLLELVNEARAARGLSALARHETAETLARRQAEQIMEQGEASHYSTAGEKCELRFNRLGETDQVQENVIMTAVQQRVHLTPQTVKYIMRRWMESSGHRANILDPQHTHMGGWIAVATTAKDGEWIVGGVQEFVRRYGDYDNLPDTMRPGTRFSLTGSLDPGMAQFAYIGIGREELPTRSLYRQSLQRECVYSQPAPGIVYVANVHDVLRFGLNGTVHEKVEIDKRGGGFSVFIESGKDWEGAYYVTVWATPADDPAAAAFCAMTQVVLVE